MNRVSIFILALILSTGSIFAQPGASGARIGVTVVEPITYTKSVDLNFEPVTIIFAGSDELVPTSVKAASASIVLPVTMGTFTAASYFVGGEAYTYKVTVPQTPFEVTTSNENLIVRSYDTDPMLDRDSGLLAGVSVSVSPMNVTVNYN